MLRRRRLSAEASASQCWGVGASATGYLRTALAEKGGVSKTALVEEGGVSRTALVEKALVEKGGASKSLGWERGCVKKHWGRKCERKVS